MEVELELTYDCWLYALVALTFCFDTITLMEYETPAFLWSDILD